MKSETPTYTPEWWPPKWIEATAKLLRHTDSFRIGPDKYYIVDNTDNARFPRWYVSHHDCGDEAELDTLLEVYCWLLARDPANPHREDIPHAQEPDDP